MSGPIFCARLSPVGGTSRAVVLAGDNGQAQVWNIDTSAGTASFAFALYGHDPSAEVTWVDHSGTAIVTASADGSAKIWNTNGELQRTLRYQAQESEPDESTWEVVFAEFTIHDDRVLTVAIDPDSDERRGAVHLWDAATGNHLYRLSATGLVFARFNFEGNGVAVVTVTGTEAVAADPGAEGEAGSSEDEEAASEYPTDWSESITLYAMNADGSIEESSPLATLSDNRSGINSVAFGGANYMVVASDDDGVTFYQQDNDTWDAAGSAPSGSGGREYAEFAVLSTAVYGDDQGTIAFAAPSDLPGMGLNPIDEKLPGKGSDRWINAVRVDRPAGAQWVVAANENGTAEVWPVSGGNRPIVLGVPAHIAVSPKVPWVETGVVVGPSSPATVTYVSGSWAVAPGGPSYDAGGNAGTPSGLDHPAPNDPAAGLVGRLVLADGTAQDPFFIGRGPMNVTSTEEAQLQLGVNDTPDGFSDNVGFIVVTIDQAPASS